MLRGRTQRGQPRRRAPGVKRQVNALKSALHGHQNKIAHVAPPSITLRPYNNLVISHVVQEAGVELFIGPVQIITYLANQLGLQAQTKTSIVFKIRRIDYYAVPVGSSSDRPACNMTVGSLVPALGDPATPSNAAVSYGNLAKLQDVGSLQDCAKLSYTFPLHMADIPLSEISNFIFCEVAANTTNSELRFHVSWSTISTAAPVA